MICFVALIVLGILGIFSAKYRALAGEAFDCVFRRVTLRKCNTGFDDKMKAAITARLARWPALARAIYQNFEALSWLLTILMLVSIFFTLQGAYYYYLYGNCNGPNSTAFCIFGAFSGKPLVPPEFTDGVALGNPNAPENQTIYTFACFTCPYSRAAWPGLKAFLAAHPDYKAVYKPFPLPNHAYSNESSAAGLCAAEQGKFVEFADLAFENQSDIRNEKGAALSRFAVAAGLNTTKFDSCMAAPSISASVQHYFTEGLDSNIYGTPTFFVNGRAAVGPLSEANFNDLVAGRAFTPDAPVDEGFCPPPSVV